MLYTIFSILFVFLISPFNWVIALLLMAVLFKGPKWKKRTLMSALILLLFFSNPFLLQMWARCWDVAPVPLVKGKVYSVAIVLGGFTAEDVNKKGFFTEHSDRLIEGMKLKTTGQVSHVMISGGNNSLDADQFTEGEWVGKTMKEFNIPDSAIFIDHKSRNTAENAAYSKEILSRAHLPQPYLLVTSAFHMRRAIYDFKKKGIDAIPYPCDYIAGNTKPGLTDYFVPSLYTLYYWNYYIKELFGLAMAHVKA